MFGYSVLLAGNGQKLAIGARYNDSNGDDSGQVKVFEWVEATSSYQQLGDSFLGDAASDVFGWSVSFLRDGTTLAIGANKKGEASGQVKIFAWDEEASIFEQIGQSLYGKAPGSVFGYSVALLSEGKTLAIGVPGGPFFAAYVEVYACNGVSSVYKQLGQSLCGDEDSYNQFGSAVALAANGRVLSVGAPYSDRNGADSGRVEVFDTEL